MGRVYAGTSPSMAASATGLLPRVPITQSYLRLGIPHHLSTRSFAQSLKIHRHGRSFSESRRLLSVQAKASSTEDASSDESEDLLADLKDKWDKLENKSAILAYGGGAIVAVWLSATVVGSIDSVPLLPNLMELVGLGYTGWFVYRYLLFQSGRKELAEDIQELKNKITGSE